jgi:hypothetical protein
MWLEAVPFSRPKDACDGLEAVASFFTFGFSFALLRTLHSLIFRLWQSIGVAIAGIIVYFPYSCFVLFSIVQSIGVVIPHYASFVLFSIVQSIGVAIAGIIVYFRPDWQIVDPIVTILFR